MEPSDVELDESDVESDDALSLAVSLNARSTDSPPREEPAPSAPHAEPLRVERVLGLTTGTHLPGAGRERLLLVGGGTVWTLGPTDMDPPRILPVGSQDRHGPGHAPVEAVACSPGGLIVLAHRGAPLAGARASGAAPRASSDPDAPTPTKLTVWSAPALGLQTPRCLASLECDRPLSGGGASSVGFAGGAGVPFVWVAGRTGRGANLLAFDWRRQYDHASSTSDADAAGAISGGAVEVRAELALSDGRRASTRDFWAHAQPRSTNSALHPNLRSPGLPAGLGVS